MGSNKQIVCPMCGIKVRIDAPTRMMAEHTGWSGDRCRGSGKTGTECYEILDAERTTTRTPKGRSKE